MRIVRGLVWRMHWLAKTISTSEVPTPNATAPKAPWVEVWLSPQTIVMPGWVNPSSGPMMCTMPCLGCPTPKCSMPWRAQFSASVSTCRRDSGSPIGRCWSTVGMLWSAVAVICAGRATPKPRRSIPAKATGDVTSWIYCRSM